MTYKLNVTSLPSFPELSGTVPDKWKTISCQSMWQILCVDAGGYKGLFVLQNMAPQSLNLVSLVVVDKRTKVLVIGRDQYLQVPTSIMSWIPKQIQVEPLKHQNVDFKLC